MFSMTRLLCAAALGAAALVSGISIAAAEELTPKVPSTVGPAIKSVAPAVGGATGAQVGQWVSMILSNGQKIEVHPEDKEELLRRDPGAKVGQ